MVDPKLVLMLAVFTLLLVGGILDRAWRRQQEPEGPPGSGLEHQTDPDQGL